MKIEILEPGSAGIFGLVGGRKAKIKVMVPAKELGASKEIDTESVVAPSFETETETNQQVEREIIEDSPADHIKPC